MLEEHREKTLENSASEIAQNIEGHIEKEMFMIVKREQIDENEEICGFPLALSDNLLVMSKIADFHDEGFSIMRTADISDAFSRESDAFYEEICKKEGLLKKAHENPIKDATDFAIVLRQLIDCDKYVSILCEYADDELFYSVGEIAYIENNIVHFNNFNRMGDWEDTERLIPIDKITLVSIGDYYANMYYKYVKPLPES
jgi:hypothetical protein